ncbi:hypothetical protein [Rufibacter roseus]|uniref:Lipoprotein n=1 Tax=Rufibacter roseus TaxID=1567108 RepID=A0ABW2DPQ1_9BACT|nr:hypothetical protein [Rufibacter roseus]
MKFLLKFCLPILALGACTSSHHTNSTSSGVYQAAGVQENNITQSLFQDKDATISEENIQRIMNGTYSLPNKLRVALVKLENSKQRHYYWNDEDYLKTQQAYVDLFSEQLLISGRVTKNNTIPDLLLPSSPGFTTIREAAVRMQADVVLVFTITNDVYSRYKFLSKNDIKAFATTQAVLIDVRTGLVPFSTVVTRDYLSQKQEEELNQSEAVRRIQKEAVLLTIQEIGQQLNEYLAQ